MSIFTSGGHITVNVIILDIVAPPSAVIVNVTVVSPVEVRVIDLPF